MGQGGRVFLVLLWISAPMNSLLPHFVRCLGSEGSKWVTRLIMQFPDQNFSDLTTSRRCHEDHCQNIPEARFHLP